ncbi:secretion system X translation initiation factor [Pseudomonas citronellolis]|uniref:secretion system X translation initiation factor n=1 Tax=Pseudomonas citronellolis TaxID=53408 RepID=UPI0023E479C3|nr:secretion system X translation initiation factor [Pseudomonas citronellolis]MDF3935220.1 secretion system X translation initiation factor [Pseudomonas citronellolis]
MNRRLLFWMLFLGGAAALALGPQLFERDAPIVALRAAAPGAKPAAAAPAGAATVAAAEPAANAWRAGPDLFPVQSWRKPKPAPDAAALAAAAAAVAPPPPSAPALPFQFLGRMDDAAQRQVFLRDGERVLIVRSGDVIDDTYRVERIADDRLTLVYLPLKVAQSLVMEATP